jgi:NAD+ diphosphatase
MSAPPRFTGMPLDRASSRRSDPEWVAELGGAPERRAVVAGPDSVVVDRSGEALLRVPVTRPEILLGLEEGVPLFAVELDGDAPAGGRAVSLREAGAMLPQSEGGLAAYAVALLNWHRRHRYCANCGHPSEVVEAGYMRSCPNCGASHFPRTDPVVIMLVEHEGSLLLGRRAGWPRGRLSVLAGFVSPGETLEEAVVREVREESGIIARNPVYVASQPWPFPASLMLGFNTTSDGGDPVARDGELEEVGWFSLSRVQAAARHEGDFALPPPVSIARFLIDRWLARR